MPWSETLPHFSVAGTVLTVLLLLFAAVGEPLLGRKAFAWLSGRRGGDERALTQLHAVTMAVHAFWGLVVLGVLLLSPELSPSALGLRLPDAWGPVVGGAVGGLLALAALWVLANGLPTQLPLLDRLPARKGGGRRGGGRRARPAGPDGAAPEGSGGPDDPEAEDDARQRDHDGPPEAGGRAGRRAAGRRGRRASAAPMTLPEPERDRGLLVPRTGRERGMAAGVAVTGGVFGELLYRGLFIALVAGMGVPLWAAAVLSVVLFSVAHLYQGWWGLVSAGTSGTLFTILYLGTGSIWVPILVHVALDLRSLVFPPPAVREEGERLHDEYDDYDDGYDDYDEGYGDGHDDGYDDDYDDRPATDADGSAVGAATPDDAFPADAPPAAPAPGSAPASHGGPGTPPHGTPPHGTPAHGTPAHGTPAHGTPAHGTRALGAAPTRGFDADATGGSPYPDGPLGGTGAHSAPYGDPSRDAPGARTHGAPSWEGPSPTGAPSGDTRRPWDSPAHGGPAQDSPSWGGPAQGGAHAGAPAWDTPAPGGAPSHGGPSWDAPAPGGEQDTPSWGGPAPVDPPPHDPRQPWERPAQEGPRHGDPYRSEPHAGDPYRSEPHAGDPYRSEPYPGNSHRTDSSRTDPSRSGPARGAPAWETPLPGGTPSHGVPPWGGPSPADQPVHDTRQPWEDPARSGLPSWDDPGQSGPEHGGPPPRHGQAWGEDRFPPAAPDPAPAHWDAPRHASRTDPAWGAHPGTPAHDGPAWGGPVQGGGHGAPPFPHQGRDHRADGGPYGDPSGGGGPGYGVPAPHGPVPGGAPSHGWDGGSGYGEGPGSGGRPSPGHPDRTGPGADADDFLGAPPQPPASGGRRLYPDEWIDHRYGDEGDTPGPDSARRT